MTIAVFLPSAKETARLARRMTEELRRLNHAVMPIELPGRFPDPDQTAITAARAAWSRVPTDAPRLISGTVLAAFTGLPPHKVTALLFRPPEADAALLRDVPRVAVPSEALQLQLSQAFAVPAERIAVIAPGIDPLPRSTGSDGAACRILSVGAVIPRKGHDVLMRALSRLLDLEWTLTLAGPVSDQVWAGSLRALAGELRVAERVSFAAEPTWSNADLFALASHEEGYGSAIAEALRRGLPVAVTNVGAVPTLVPPDAGVVCSPGDVEQLSKALRRLIFDRALRRDMAEAAWQAGQALPSWPEQAGRMAEIILG
jgi:glycosyltransferase involved in cell wall biosynthesis